MTEAMATRSLKASTSRSKSRPRVAQLLDPLHGLAGVGVCLAQTQHVVQLRARADQVLRLVLHRDARVAGLVRRVGHAAEVLGPRSRLRVPLEGGLGVGVLEVAYYW